MSTRIRYEKTTSLEGYEVLVSKQYFKVNGVDCKIYLDETNFQFLITDAMGIVLKKGGNTKNKAVLKIQAKEALQEMGFIFNEEKRNYES